MRIVIIGDGHSIRPGLVAALRSAGHEVGTAFSAPGVLDGSDEDLARTLNGAAVVVDLLELPCLQDEMAVEFFTTATRNILSLEAAAGIRHHVALSAAGAEQGSASGYFRARSAQERLIATSPIPYSIVRSTLLFESLTRLADASTRGPTVYVPPVLVQPIAASDVIRLLASVAVETPLNGIVEIGGPEPFFLDQLTQRALGSHNDPREVIADGHSRYRGVQPGERSLMAGAEAELGAVRFEDWLQQTATARGGAPRADAALKANEFRISDVPSGSVWLMGNIAVFGVEGGFCATQEMCTHHAGPLSEGTIDGTTITCPLHGAQFNIWTGAVLRGPAKEPLKTFRVIVDGDVGRVEIDVPARR